MAADPGKYPGAGSPGQWGRWERRSSVPEAKKSSISFLAPTIYIRYSWFWSGPHGRPGRIRASDLQTPSPNRLVAHPLDLPNIPKSKIPKIQNPKSPKSKIQNPNSPKSKIQDPKSPKSKIPNPQNPKSKPQNPQNPKSPKSKIPKIQNPKSPKSKVQNPKSPKSKIQTFLAGFWGFWILDFGALWSNSLREAPNAPNLEFGFWGFWILGILDFVDFGSWILDFGAGIPNPKSEIQTPQSKLFWPNFGDFGFWILDRYVAILYVRPQRPKV